MNKKIILSLLAVIAVIISAQMLDFSEEADEPLYHIFKSYLLFDNLTDMYERSQMVIYGVEESSDTDSTYYSNIHTHFTVNIDEMLKGNHTSNTIVVTQDGGVYNGENVR